MGLLGDFFEASAKVAGLKMAIMVYKEKGDYSHFEKIVSKISDEQLQDELSDSFNHDKKATDILIREKLARRR